MPPKIYAAFGLMPGQRKRTAQWEKSAIFFFFQVNIFKLCNQLSDLSEALSEYLIIKTLFDLPLFVSLPYLCDLLKASEVIYLNHPQ